MKRKNVLMVTVLIILNFIAARHMISVVNAVSMSESNNTQTNNTKSFSNQESPVFQSHEEVGEYIKTKMKEKAEYETFYIETDKEFEKDWYSLWRNLAFTDTGVPDEGDYLKHCYNSMGLNNFKTKALENGKYSHGVVFYASYRVTLEQEKELDKEIKSTLNKIGAYDNTLSDYEKVKKIYDFICRNIEYGNNQKADQINVCYTAHSALIDREAKCLGYAALVYRMCEEVGVDARIITSTRHAWNIVEIENKYYFVDTTYGASGYRGMNYPWERDSDFLCGYDDLDPESRTPDEYSKKILEKYNYSKTPYDKYEIGEIKLSKTSYDYDGKTKKPDVIVKNKQGKIIDSANYTVKYQTGSNPGKYRVVLKMNGAINETAFLYYTILPAPKVKSVSLSKTNYTYNGKVQKPSVVVKDSKGNIISKNNYTVKYSTGCKKVGKYKVTVTMRGIYAGTYSKTFDIKPKNTAITKLSKAKKAFTIKLKKQTEQTTGYQIQYSTKKNFKNPKTITVNNEVLSKKISKLSSKKCYYVRVRSFKKASGTRFYSSWSSIKSIKTK